MFDLTDRTALVTGGAPGLGYAMARALGYHDARLLLLDRRAEAVRHAAATLGEEGLITLAVAGDVTRRTIARGPWT